jgi:hypothetical protein
MLKATWFVTSDLARYSNNATKDKNNTFYNSTKQLGATEEEKKTELGDNCGVALAW